jgi:hypothetical protein
MHGRARHKIHVPLVASCVRPAWHESYSGMLASAYDDANISTMLRCCDRDSIDGMQFEDFPQCMTDARLTAGEFVHGELSRVSVC